MRDLGIIAFMDASVQRRAYKQRRAARAVLRDADGHVALLEVAKHGYWKLPGGGLDPGEDFTTALARECREETGCTIRITGEIGVIIEYRDQLTLRQESHCYTADVVGEKRDPTFEQDERDEGFRLHWLTVSAALAALRASAQTTYEAQFIVPRDLRFLEVGLEVQ